MYRLSAVLQWSTLARGCMHRQHRRLNSLLRWISALLLAMVAPVRGVDHPVSVEDSAAIDALVNQLGADDPLERDNAAVSLEDRPDEDLPLLQTASRREDLTAEIKLRLRRLLRRIEPRVKAHQRANDRFDTIGAWAAKMAMEWYEKDGHTNPAWDDSVRKALSISAARAHRLSAAELAKTLAEEKDAIATAMTAGCDDPGFLVVAGLCLDDSGLPADQVFAYFHKALISCADGKVSPYTKTIIDGRILRGSMTGLYKENNPKNTARCDALLNDMIQSCQLVMTMPGIPNAARVETVENVINTGAQARSGAKSDFLRGLSRLGSDRSERFGCAAH